MLKKCYYFDQGQYDNVDFIYLHRFIDMHEYFVLTDDELAKKIHRQRIDGFH